MRWMEKRISGESRLDRMKEFGLYRHHSAKCNISNHNAVASSQMLRPALDVVSWAIRSIQAGAA